MTHHSNNAASVLTDADIDLIANAGHRNAVGGVYATSVHDFARAIEAAVWAEWYPPVAHHWQPIDTAPVGIRILLGPRQAPVVGIVRITWNPDFMRNESIADVVHYNGSRLVAGYHCTEWAPLCEAAMPARMADVTPPATAHERRLYHATRLAAQPSSGQAQVQTQHPHPDDLAVDRFAAAMKAKLTEKRAQGRAGWDDKARCSAQFLSELLRVHFEKGDPLDVGNLAMMLHQRGERIVAANAALCADERPHALREGVASHVVGHGLNAPASVTYRNGVLLPAEQAAVSLYIAGLPRIPHKAASLRGQLVDLADIARRIRLTDAAQALSDHLGGQRRLPDLGRFVNDPVGATPQKIDPTPTSKADATTWQEVREICKEAHQFRASRAARRSATPAASCAADLASFLGKARRRFQRTLATFTRRS